MSNPYFQFKQFTVYQDKCAMKVSTDACLFGAWVAAYIGQREMQNMLDIGCGTGLLSLMLAQKVQGKIDSLEIDEQASLQARQNCDNSPWKDRINVIHADVRDFHFNHQYDLIISNPPFYEHDLRAARLQSNMARHDETLTLEVLLSIGSRQLAPEGSFAVLMPYKRYGYCTETAAKFSLFPEITISVRQSERHSFFRSMMLFKKQSTPAPLEKELAIKVGNSYSAEFTGLLKDYHLFL